MGGEMHRLDNYNPGEKIFLIEQLKGTKLKTDACLKLNIMMV